MYNAGWQVANTYHVRKWQIHVYMYPFVGLLYRITGLYLRWTYVSFVVQLLPPTRILQREWPSCRATSPWPRIHCGTGGVRFLKPNGSARKNPSSLRGDTFHLTVITEAIASLILGLAQLADVAYFDTLTDHAHPYNVISIAISFGRRSATLAMTGKFSDFIMRY